MPLETRAHARRAEQRRLGQLQDSISAPQVHGPIFERLLGTEQRLTVGRLSLAWREWAAPKRGAAQEQRLAELAAADASAGRLDPHRAARPCRCGFWRSSGPSWHIITSAAPSGSQRATVI